ncbi:MAG: sigma factor-like helix-turn-helix DNA-binding protein [Terracidiphilus sp.]
MRKAIQLRDIEWLTMSEGARIMGVAEGTFKSQVSRARSKLKRLIQTVKIDPDVKKGEVHLNELYTGCKAV